MLHGTRGTLGRAQGSGDSHVSVVTPACRLCPCMHLHAPLRPHLPLVRISFLRSHDARLVTSQMITCKPAALPSRSGEHLRCVIRDSSFVTAGARSLAPPLHPKAPLTWDMSYSRLLMTVHASSLSDAPSPLPRERHASCDARHTPHNFAHPPRRSLILPASHTTICTCHFPAAAPLPSSQLPACSQRLAGPPCPSLSPAGNLLECPEQTRCFPAMHAHPKPPHLPSIASTSPADAFLRTTGQGPTCRSGKVQVPVPACRVSLLGA